MVELSTKMEKDLFMPTAMEAIGKNVHLSVVGLDLITHGELNVNWIIDYNLQFFYFTQQHQQNCEYEQ